MKETKRGQSENRKTIKMPPCHRVFEWEKVDHKIKCFQVVKKIRIGKIKGKKLAVSAVRKTDAKYRHASQMFRVKREATNSSTI